MAWLRIKHKFRAVAYAAYATIFALTRVAAVQTVAPAGVGKPVGRQSSK